MCLIILAMFIALTNTAQAALPDIGDNSLFVCKEYDFGDGTCAGDIAWVANANGISKGNRIISLKKAKRLAKKFARAFKKKRKKAKKQGNSSNVEIYEAKRLNAIQSKTDVKTCYFTEQPCSSGDDSSSNVDVPSASEACTVVANPTSENARSNKRIVNGAICSAVSNSPILMIRNHGSQWCTGSLIGVDTVLTAAHCVQGIDCANLSVETNGGSKAANVSSCVAHPDYGSASEGQAHDVAVLTLASDIVGITPLKVHSGPTVALDTLAVLPGYGRNENNDTELRAVFNNISSFTTEVISTVYTQGGDDGTTCNGDSGGPLLVYVDGEWKIHGTLSDGSAADCALPGTNPTTDTSNWANINSSSNINFIQQNSALSL